MSPVFFRSKLGLFQSRISLQKASVKVSRTLTRTTAQPMEAVRGKLAALLGLLRVWKQPNGCFPASEAPG